MGRREKPAKTGGEGKRPRPRKSPGALLRETRRALAEAVEQQAATAAILRVIASSPADIQPVLDAVAKNAARLCEADDAEIYRVDGDVYRRVAHHGPVSIAGPLGEAYPITRGRPSSRAIVDRATIHVHDQAAQAATEFPDVRAWPAVAGVRTVLATPLLRDDVALGVIVIRRTEVKPFSDEHIALLRTFADQATIAIENVRLFTALQEKNRALTETLEQQTATGEILRVIASSPTDFQPVFDAILKSALTLCEGSYSGVYLVSGDMVDLVAHSHRLPESLHALKLAWPMPVQSPESLICRAIRERTIVHVSDTETDPTVPPASRERSRLVDQRAMLAVPMLREEVPIGAIRVARPVPTPFTDTQIELLKTFAAQAVIAIENVRLFTELQAKNQALTEAHAQVTEALEQQTATAEILRAIAASPTEIQPVLDTIARNAARVCNALDASLVLIAGDTIRIVARFGPLTTPIGLEIPLDRRSMPGRAAIDRQTIAVEDTRELPETEYPLTREFSRRYGHRSAVATPLLRQGAAIGALFVRRAEVHAFTEGEIALLKTFADQAVIAIENVRLFNETREALQQQTATSEILRVISSSPTNVQPVFEAIVTSGVALFEGAAVAVVWPEEGQVRLAAIAEADAERAARWRERFPFPLTGDYMHGVALVERRLVDVPDVLASDVAEPGRQNFLASGYRAITIIPMLREQTAIGAISVVRPAPGALSDKQLALLKTFADQAVIAIENVRLFNELQARTSELTRSVDELTALGEVGQALGSTLDLETVLRTIVTRANQLAGTAGCVIWEYDESRAEFRLRASHYADELDTVALPGPGGTTTIPKGHGVTTQVVELRRPVQIADIAIEGAYDSPVRAPLLEAGHRALLGVPLIFEEDVIGVLAVTRKTPGEFAPEVVRLLTTFATQSALAIQNARLFREIEEKSRELAAASQHKSEFLANMSHELRTPLNAIIGFSEVLTERMFGELNDKQDEYLRDIHASGQHLLSLINDILDLSKIEAGRMELELVDFHLPAAIDDALTLVRERASRRGVILQGTVDERLGDVRADQRKVKQVLLNLLSNAIKFTPQGGRIQVRAVPVDGSVELSVSDTGVGIAPEDHDAVFEEFRQVGTADKKAEGTGLGLALCKKFVELHGGRIWVKSQVGAGSTFTFTLPLRR